jgi:hypothetical protein
MRLSLVNHALAVMARFQDGGEVQAWRQLRRSVKEDGSRKKRYDVIGTAQYPPKSGPDANLRFQSSYPIT